MSHTSQAAVVGLDFTALAAILSAAWGFLPVIAAVTAALLGAAWYGLQLYEALRYTHRCPNCGRKVQ